MTSQFIVEFSQNIDSCFDIDKAYTTTLTLAKFDNMKHNRHESIGDPMSSHTHAPHGSNPGTPILLSPTSSAASPSTPRNSAFPWDSPQTPLQRLDPASFDLSTPLTPPTTSEGTLKTNLFTSEFIQATPCRTGAGHERSSGMRKLVPKARDSQIVLSVNHTNHADKPINELFHDPGLASDGTKDENVENSTAESHTEVDRVVSPEAIPSIPDASGDDVDFAARSSQQIPSRSTFPGPLMISTDLRGPVGPVAESIFSAISRRSKISVHDLEGTAYRQEVVLTEDVEPTRSTLGLQSLCRTVTELDVVQPPPKFDRVALPITITNPEKSAVNIRYQGQMTRTTTPHVGAKHIHVEAATVSQTMKPFEGLRATLNRILPFEFIDRMSYDPGQCVVNYVGDSFQCRATAKGTESAANASIKAITSCIRSSDYLALPDHIEKLVANTRCGRHKPKGSASSQALDTLRDLIVSLSNVSREDLSTFGTWLEAISNSGAPAFADEAVASHHQFTWAISLSVILDRIMPFRMQARLRQRPNRCVVAGCKELHSKCDDGLEEQRYVIDASIGTIVQCVAISTYNNLPSHIRRLAEAIMCPSHRGLADSDLHLLQAIIRNLAHISSQYLSAFRAWIRAITGCELSPLPAAVTNTLLPGGTVTVQFDTDAVKVRADDIAPHFSSEFTPYRAKGRSNHEIAEVLRSKIEKPLTSSDMKDGFVYMFWDQQHFGMIKIGRTIDLEKRLNQWDSQCKVTHHYHQSSRDGQLLKIPHVQRIEKLMHTELGNYRKKRACNGCGKNHIEWFDIDEAKAREVFQKWRDWIIQKPYALDHKGKWTVRPEMLDSLSEVCKPVDFSDAGSVPKRRASRKLARLVNVH